MEFPLIFNGLFESKEFELEKDMLSRGPNQLVFLDFTHLNIYEYYQLEILAYEIWKCGASSRVLAKGGTLLVDQDNPGKFEELCSNELAELVRIYDRRDHVIGSSNTGTVFNRMENERKGYTIVPLYNAGKESADFVNSVLSAVGVQVPDEYIPNYALKLLPVKNYFHAHLPLSPDFEKKHKTKFEYVIQTLLIICDYPLIQLIAFKDYAYTLQLIKRGFQQLSRDELFVVLKRYWEASREHYVTNVPYNVKEINKAIDFLTLRDRATINILNPGPWKLILPGIRKGKFILDHSLITEFLVNLFTNLPLEEHNFRGDTLEDALNLQQSFLPKTPCKSINGTRKQIDFSFKKGNILIIAECKVVAMSLGIFTGDVNAINHRKRSVILKGLNQVDDKARWLKENIKGTNYDIKGFDYILPVAISPFVEFIDSFNPFYWIDSGTPRVLTIYEFKEFVEKDLDPEKIYNIIKI